MNIGETKYILFSNEKGKYEFTLNNVKIKKYFMKKFFWVYS